MARSPSPSVGEIGALFRDLRLCLKLSLPEIARRLETHIDVVEALESGSFDHLPPWPETVRVVSAYTLLAGIDPRPVLHVMRDEISSRPQTAAIAPALRPAAIEGRPEYIPLPPPRSSPAPVAAAMPQQGVVNLMAAAPRLGRPLAGRAALMWVMAGAAVAIGLAMAVGPSERVNASAASGPSLLSRLLGGGSVPPGTATERDGHLWVDVADPRSRRSDKLHSPRQ